MSIEDEQKQSYNNIIVFEATWCLYLYNLITELNKPYMAPGP